MVPQFREVKKIVFAPLRLQMSDGQPLEIDYKIMAKNLCDLIQDNHQPHYFLHENVNSVESIKGIILTNEYCNEDTERNESKYDDLDVD